THALAGAGWHHHDAALLAIGIAARGLQAIGDLHRIGPGGGGRYCQRVNSGAADAVP
nr:hypothetical protein [Tanacetum cinerariifolium]